MYFKKILLFCLLVFLIGSKLLAQSNDFVAVNGHTFAVHGKPYYYIGANYWYGGLVANDEKGKNRIKKELDFLALKGINNLRVLAGAEGAGQINGVPRVEPALQPKAGVFKKDLLNGLDFLLAEMGKRNMKAVIFLSNNWEWSGGFLQYLNWNGMIADTVLRRKLSWDEMRDFVSQFYSCENCMQQYEAQVKMIVQRTNSLTHKKYKDDATIMAWEIVNEPRPMRPSANETFKKFISRASSFIKSMDKNHLVTTGGEGLQATESIDLFKEIHAFKNIDYATIHVWPKNWGWFKDTAIAEDLNNIISKSNTYIKSHIPIMQELNKPLVIEEFGLPRNLQSFYSNTPTTLRDEYYASIFNELKDNIKQNGVIAGANFWAFSGIGRPSHKQLLWAKGDDVLGDPSVEEQGLNSVFDTDETTWQLIEKFIEELKDNN